MKRPIIIKSSLVPRGLCVNLFGTLWARDPSWIDGYVVNHERIHTAQQREMLFVFFYIVYLVEWMIRLAQHRNWHKAYRSISFEREAYRHGNDLTYLPRRRHFAQWHHQHTKHVN